MKMLRFKSNEATPKVMLWNLIAKAEQINSILIVYEDKDGETRIGWSDQENKELLWLGQCASQATKNEIF